MTVMLLSDKLFTVSKPEGLDNRFATLCRFPGHCRIVTTNARKATCEESLCSLCDSLRHKRFTAFKH